MKALLSIIISICLLLAAPASQLSAEGQSIRLGYIQPDNSLVNPHVLRQYYISYLDELSKHTDWDYHLVNITADTAFERLFAGDIDLLLSVEYPSSLGLRGGIIYSAIDFGYDVEGLYSRSGETRFDAHDLNTLEGARVGIIAARPINKKFEQFQQNNGLHFTVETFANQQDMLEALEAEKIDLVVDTATNTLPEEQFLLAYSRIPVRAAAVTANRDKLANLENAINRLNMENPHFEPQLSQTLAEKIDFQLVHYTPQESQYIKTMPPLRVAIYGGVYPYILYDDATKTATGIYPDLIAQLAKNSGLEFTYVHVPTYDDAVNLLKTGKADLMLDIFAGPEDHHPFYYTNPLTTLPYTFIGSTNQTPSSADNIKLIVPRPEPSLMNFLQQKFPSWDITASPAAAADALNALDLNSETLALVRNSILEIDRPLMLHPGLAIIPDASINVPISLIIAPNQPRMLQGIINKAIIQTNPEKRLHITQKHIIKARPGFSLKHILSFYPLQAGFLCGLILLLLAGMFFLNHHSQAMSQAKKLLQEKNAMLTATVKELKEANQSKNFYKEKAEIDALTGVLNKAAIESVGREILANALQPGRCHALFIIDLDHFKEANDTLGHQKGDEILRQFALYLVHIVRANDAVGRFGGDEFILILRDFPQEGVASVARRVMEAAHSLEPANEHFPGLSASIGIALYPVHGNNYHELLHHADQALYHVKENGRNNWALAGQSLQK